MIDTEPDERSDVNLSTRTSNLQLHLWAEDDYVLMSDFNADHAAIDAYVTTAANDAAARKQELLEGPLRKRTYMAFMYPSPVLLLMVTPR